MTASDDDSEDGLLSPDLVEEYLRNLQDGLDAAMERSERLVQRVRKLEHDREVLRQRLAAARSLAARRTVRGRLRQFRAKRTPDSVPTERSEGVDGPASAVLPVVGRIGPVSWPEPSPRRDLRIALVADEFTSTALSYEAHCLDLPASEAVQQLRQRGADVLLVESAYQGILGTWARKVARFGGPHEDLVSLVEAARSMGIPTVFWNKEDPVNTDWFIASARLFDHVFTVDENRVDAYRRLFRHDRVHVLPFAAQPRIHRPPSRFEDRVGPILFAGSWFARKHPERRAQMDMLLDPARAHGLHILDRHSGTDNRFMWPREFHPHIVGSLSYPLAVEAARRYRVVVNINTVTDSPTMCARRVFELAASATPIVSAPSQALDVMVPADAIKVVGSREEADAAYLELMNEPRKAARLADAARTWVLAGHTWEHRLDELVSHIGSGRPDRSSRRHTGSLQPPWGS